MTAAETKAESERLTALEVRADFDRRREQRRATEAQWVLNTCFIAGRQYAEITPVFGVEDSAPTASGRSGGCITTSRPYTKRGLAKLAGVRPVMSVRPASGSDEDLKTADASSKILAAVSARLETENVVSRATAWSELDGHGVL